MATWRQSARKILDMKKLTLFRKCLLLVTGLMIALVVTGCVRDNKNSVEQSYQKWKAMAEDSQGYSPRSKRRMSTLGDSQADARVTAVSPETTVSSESETIKPLPTAPVSLNMSDVDVAVLLRSLARAAGLNIMINETVAGRANINIQKAPWDQVFLGILKTHGLSYQWEGDIIRIMTTADLEQALQKASQKMDLRELEPLATRIIRIDYTDAASLKTTLQAFLTRSKAGKIIGSIMVDTHTNTLIVQALAEDIANMLPLVEKLDLPTPQILIEAHIVEANSSTARELGIQWGGQYQIDSKNTIGSGAASSGSNIPNVPSGNYAFNFPANVGNAAGMAIGYVFNDGANTLVAQLSALQNERKLKILSSPSITTIDNQKAVFESGEEVPYQSVDDGNVKTEFKEALLKLEVTPHVIDGEALKLSIKVNKDEVDKSVANNPPIITKKAETIVILYDGQTTVIGGLKSARDSRSDSGVPGLKDIPGLGVLFRGETTEKDMDDVMIFITPHILKQRIGGSGSTDTTE